VTGLIKVLLVVAYGAEDIVLVSSSTSGITAFTRTPMFYTSTGTLKR
jgi:hypothetical protein